MNNSPYIDLEDAPTFNQVYGRETQLDILKNWIFEDKTQLITIYGWSGIGKTTLSLKLVETLKTQFNYVIYRNLKDFANLEELLEDLILIFAQDENNNNAPKIQLRTLIKYLRQNPCLIIIDNGQALLQDRELSGTYHPNYRNFSQLWQQIGENNHQSCVILNTCEIPKDIETLANNSPKIRLLKLLGLKDEAKSILKAKNLKDQEMWSEFIQLYEGNPQWLQWVATLIIDLWEGHIKEGWQLDKFLIPDELKCDLQRQINRISSLEKQILIDLSQESNILTLSDVLSRFNDSPTHVFNAIQSLKKRGLIEAKETLRIKPIVKKVIILSVSSTS